ncbi:MAG TPA: ATP-dependent dethiobiotin synthetase BioD [Micromonosporaceae bacterium]
MAEPAVGGTPMPVRGPVLITGTDTGVGKTIVTAAVAAAATAHGLRVAVVKPGQTGVLAPSPAGGAPADLPAPGQEWALESDVEIVVRLAAPATARTLVSYLHPLAPGAAARVERRAPIRLGEVAAAVRALVASHDLVLVEGAGGLLVPMGPAEPAPVDGTGRLGGPVGAAWTVAELAGLVGASVVVVARAGLGTLNHTALTLEALAARGLAGCVVVGAWPAEPELVHRTNLTDLPGELAGVLPDGAGVLGPDQFRASASSWLAPSLYGVLDVAAFVAAQSA